MARWPAHDISELIVEVGRNWEMCIAAILHRIHLNGLIFPNNARDWLDVAGCSAAKELHHATFLRCRDELSHRKLSFDYPNALLFFDLFTKFNDGLTNRAIENAAIIRRCDQFYLAIARFDHSEHIDMGHLFNEAIKGPENIIEAVALGILNSGYERTKVRGDTEAAMTEGPVFEDIGCAFKSECLWLQSGGVDDGIDLGSLGSSDTKNLVCGDVSHTQVKLGWGIVREIGVPVLINID